MKAKYEALAAALRKAADDVMFSVENASDSDWYEDDNDVSNDIAGALVETLVAAKGANYDIVFLAQRAEDGDY
jgi:hypothetical protein